MTGEPRRASCIRMFSVQGEGGVLGSDWLELGYASRPNFESATGLGVPALDGFAQASASELAAGGALPVL